MVVLMTNLAQIVQMAIIVQLVVFCPQFAASTAVAIAVDDQATRGEVVHRL
jgi:hypothetical protein